MNSFFKKYVIRNILCFFIVVSPFSLAHTQTILDKLKFKTDSTINSAINSLFTKKKNKKGNVKEDVAKEDKDKPSGSLLKEADFYQNKVIAPLQEGYSRLKIAGNLYLDVKGKYPENYKPKWRFITYHSSVNMTVEDWVAPTSGAKHNNTYIALGDVDGKAKFAFGAFINGNCYADVLIDSFAVINGQPQTFKITKFQKVLNDRQTGEPCIGLSTYTQGGFEGKITLSANENGDIKMDLMVENYVPERNTSYAGHLPAAVSYRYLANSISIANEMSPEKANGIIAAEKEAKQRQKDFMVKSQQQIDALMKVIKAKYPGYDCYSCFSRTQNFGIESTPTKTTWSDGSVDYGTDYNGYTTVTIKNKCNQKLTIIGIQQLYDEGKGYYYKEVTKTMAANEIYSIDQGLFSYVFTSALGMNADFNVQKEYNISGATLNSIQWIKIVGSKKP